MDGSPSLLIVGIDGADHALVVQWAAAGLLPNLSRLMDRGHLLWHHSTHPPLSAPAWTTAFTGCNPGRHGLYDFMDFSYPHRNPWWGQDRRCPTLWRRATEAGLRVAAVNVPMCYPAEEVDGAMISGFGSPGLTSDAFYPRALRESLLAAVPDYALQPHLDPANWPGVDELNGYTDMCARALWHILASQRADVLWVGFNALDWAGHAYAAEGSGEGSPMARVAAHVDERLGDLLALVRWPRTPVMVVSDHGMRCARRQVNLPRLFTQLGLMRLRGQPGSAAPSRSEVLLRLWHLGKRVLPSQLISVLRRSASRQREALIASSGVRIDWEHTIAAPIGAYGCVRLNVRGRDPQGVVEPEDYQSVAEETARRLAGARDGSGQPLFGEVQLRDAIYTGARLDDAPDIVLCPHASDMAFGSATHEDELLLFTAQSEVVSRLSPATGVHGNRGILLLSGDLFGRLETDGTCSLADVTPTALAVLGLPVPGGMDGLPLGPIVRRGPSTVGDSAEAAYDVYAPNEEEMLTQRLRALGYL